jgi:hypothetical protein
MAFLSFVGMLIVSAVGRLGLLVTDGAMGWFCFSQNLRIARVSSRFYSRILN